MTVYQVFQFSKLFLPLDNRISRVTDLDATKLNRLHTLELRGNKLTSTEGFKSLVNLKKLYLAKNNLDKLEGLDQLKNLEVRILV